jgi:hypothetical protein
MCKLAQNSEMPAKEENAIFGDFSNFNWLSDSLIDVRLPVWQL